MFLIAISRTGNSKLPVIPLVRSVTLSGLAFQFRWEGNEWSWEERPTGWTLRQNLVTGLTRVEFVYDGSSQTLTARVSAAAGTVVYYHQNVAGDVLLSSRVQWLREVGVPIEEATTLLPEFFVYRCLLAPATLFRNIYRVPFGGELTCAFQSERPTLTVTTLAERLESSATTAAPPVERLVESLRDVFRPLAAHRDRMGMLMSGGIDSAATCRLATVELGLRRTISTSYPFEDPTIEVERQYALTAAAAMGFEHEHFQTTTARYLSGLVEAIALAESPLHHLQSVCLYLLQKDGMKPSDQIVLQGLGAGGIVGNFRNFLFLRNKTWAKFAAAAPCYHLLKLSPSLTGRGSALLAKLADLRNRLPLSDPRNPIWAWHCYGDLDWVCSRFNVSATAVFARHIEFVQRTCPNNLEETWARYALAGDEEATLAIFSLMSEINGRVGVFPYYADGFLQCAESIPWSVKLAAPENNLRKSLGRAVGVPEFVLHRRKAGFGIRREDWALPGGPFEPVARLAVPVVGQKELDAVRSRDRGQAMIFWGLLNYALWKRICVNGESATDLAAEVAS